MENEFNRHDSVCHKDRQRKMTVFFEKDGQVLCTWKVRGKKHVEMFPAVELVKVSEAA